MENTIKINLGDNTTVYFGDDIADAIESVMFRFPVGTEIKLSIWDNFSAVEAAHDIIANLTNSGLARRNSWFADGYSGNWSLTAL
jgi:hypothetical protein